MKSNCFCSTAQWSRGNLWWASCPRLQHQNKIPRSPELFPSISCFLTILPFYFCCTNDFVQIILGGNSLVNRNRRCDRLNTFALFGSPGVVSQVPKACKVSLKWLSHNYQLHYQLALADVSLIYSFPHINNLLTAVDLFMKFMGNLHTFKYFCWKE